MNRNVSLGQASTDEVVLPERVQEALGELVGSAKEGLLALSVGVGLGVLAVLLEEEVIEVVGPRGKHDPERVALRHGHGPGEVTLGGRRVPVERPRVRRADGKAEVRLATYEHFADRDLRTLTRLGVSGSLKRTLQSTNPCDSMLEIVRRTQRNVKRWSSGEMALRWTAAGMLEAERQFRRIIGYRDLATLVVAVERELACHHPFDAEHTPTQEAAIVTAV